MQKRTAHKELHDPFAHYLRGILFFDGETFMFAAYRFKISFGVEEEILLLRKFNNRLESVGGGFHETSSCSFG